MSKMVLFEVDLSRAMALPWCGLLAALPPGGGGASGGALLGRAK